MSSPDVSKIIDTLNKHWFYRTGLVGAWITIVGLEIALFTAIKPTLGMSTLLVVATLVLVFVIWWYSRKPPKTRKGKVGFALSLRCDDENEAKKIREDFILTLQRLIRSGRTGRSFQFLEIPPHITETVIDQDDAQRLRVETRCHFLIYGRVRLRELVQQQHYYLELDGLVTHKPIPIHKHERLVAEFSELLPRKVMIAKENDLLAFEFASDWAEVVAKYIIGIAAGVSGDFKYAESLFTDALSRVNQAESDFPVFSKLQERIPVRLYELDQARAGYCYKRWTETHDDKYTKELDDIIEKIERDYSTVKTPNFLNIKSISVFITRRDTKDSLNILNAICKKDRNAVWHFNVGFLHAYDGDLRSAIRHYRNALHFEISPNSIAEIEDFICYIADSEPTKPQLYYCLGFFNWKIKGDNIQARNDLQRFLDSGDRNLFGHEIDLARRWIAEIGQSSG
jgi:hypothetical protein